MSAPTTTRRPPLARNSVICPVPQPRSSTRAPAGIASSSIRASGLRAARARKVGQRVARAVAGERGSV